MARAMQRQRIAELLIESAMRCGKFYQLLSSHSKNRQLKKIFSELSVQSKDWMQKFASRNDLIEHIQPRQPLPIDRFKDYYQLLIEKAKDSKPDFDIDDLLAEISNAKGAIQIAISFEKDNILLWEQIKNASQGELFDLIGHLISEKKARIIELLKLRGEVN